MIFRRVAKAVAAAILAAGVIAVGVAPTGAAVAKPGVSGHGGGVVANDTGWG